MSKLNVEAKAEDLAQLAPDTLASDMARWVDLTEQKRKLEAELRVIADDLAKLEPDLQERMVLAGVQNATVNGMTIYQRREFWCKLKEGVDKQAAIKKFEEAGMENCLGLQWQTLRALAKEWAENDEQPPAPIRDFVELGENFRLGTRKA